MFAGRYGRQKAFLQLATVALKDLVTPRQHRALSHTAALNQLRSDKLFQMMGNGRLGDRKLGNQLFAGHLVLSRNPFQDGETLGIGERTSDPLQLRVGQRGIIHTHSIKSIRFGSFC